MSGPILVGALAGAYGVSGEVRLKSFCAEPADIERYNPLADESGAQYTVAIIRSGKNELIARVAEIATKEEADAKRGTQLYAPRDRLPSLPDDEFYHADLIDLEVLDTGGRTLGRVKTVLSTGAGDLLEVIVPGASQTVLVPFTRAVVPTVDLATGRIIADPPEGLFE